LMLLCALLLRPQDQKIHDDEDQHEGQQLHPHAVAAERASLSKRGRHKHPSVLCAFTPRAIAPRRHRGSKSARTIAAAGPIAMLPCPENPPIRPFGTAILQACRRPAKGAAHRPNPMAKRVKKAAPEPSRRARIPKQSAGSEGIWERVAAALERLAPGAPAAPHFAAADAFSWHPDGRSE